MLKKCQNLLADDCGMVHSAEYLFLMTVTTVGMIVGLSTYRDQLVQELGDTGVALEQLDQSYIYTVPGNGGNVVSTYDDNASPPPTDPAGSAPGGITFAAGGSENDAFGTPIIGGENNMFGP